MVAQMVAALAVALSLSLRGLHKRSLSPSGAVAAFVVGSLHMACGLPFGATLIAFYLTSSKLTKWRGDLKARLEEGHVAGGQRGASQVLANSALGASLAAAAAWFGGGSGGGAAAAALLPLIPPAFVGFYACCCSDTYSSEVGIAAARPPRLVTSLRRVPPGTNGAVSTLGLAAAAAGGALVGLVYCGAAALQQAVAETNGAGAGAAVSPGADWRLLPLAVCAGLAGSLVDSLLGATLQWSGHDVRSGRAVSGRLPAGSAGGAGVEHVCGIDLLSNTQVNVVSSALTSLLAAAAWHRWVADSM